MAGASKQDRYNDILKKIASRRPFGSKPHDDKPQTPHDRALDLLNAYDSLAKLTQGNYPNLLCYGPKALRSAAWSAVVFWYRQSAYHGFRMLELLGIWAHYHEGDMLISVGVRRLPYRAPVYDAGVYNVTIENGFSLYYEDDGQPPAENDLLLYRSVFAVEDRLQCREALAGILEDWQRELESR